VEALLPDVGWVGFDPTNNLIAGEQHIRVAVGRDDTDVPPTRGVFKGSRASAASSRSRWQSGTRKARSTATCLHSGRGCLYEAMAPRNDESSQQQQ
jgi:hypothetical protein